MTGVAAGGGESRRAGAAEEEGAAAAAAAAEEAEGDGDGLGREVARAVGISRNPPPPSAAGVAVLPFVVISCSSKKSPRPGSSALCAAGAWSSPTRP